MIKKSSQPIPYRSKLPPFSDITMLLKISTGRVSTKHSFPTGTTIKELKEKIVEITGFAPYEIEVLHGYPLKILNFSNLSATLESQGVESGSMLTVRSNPQLKEPFKSLIEMGFKEEIVQKVLVEFQTTDKSLAIEMCQQIAETEDSAPSITRKAIPADNSCLFNSIGHLLDDQFNPMRYRTMVANVIQNDPQTFTADYLDMEPANYIKWIQNPEKWGGEIEISILSNSLSIEISVADIRSATILTYGAGKGFPIKIYLLYDGIHYDAIVQEKKVGVNEPLETRIFQPEDQEVYAAVLSYVSELQKKKQFVNLSSGQLYCNICYQTLQGDKEAIAHAKQTGHQNFAQST